MDRPSVPVVIGPLTQMLVRLFAAPWLLWLSWNTAKPVTWMAAGLYFAALGVDVYAGKAARRQNALPPSWRRALHVASAVPVICIVLWIWLQHREVIILCLWLALLEGSLHLLSQLKFEQRPRVATCFHKPGKYVSIAGIPAVICAGTATVLPLCYLFLIFFVNGLAVIILLPTWRPHIDGFYHAWRVRRNTFCTMPKLKSGLTLSGIFRTIAGITILGVDAVAMFILWLFLSIASWTTTMEARVTDPLAYEPVAIPLARLCQSDPVLFQDEPTFQPAWMPPEIAKLNPTWVDITPQGAHVEFGGGFYHYGYQLSRDSLQDSPEQLGWKLEFVSEGDNPRLLKAFTLDKAEHLDQRAFIDQTLAEFLRRASLDSRGQVTHDRLMFLLKFGEVDLARQSIRQAAAAHTDDWADHLYLWIIDHRIHPDATARLDAWAAGKGDSSAWLLAAYAYGLGDEPDLLERSAQRALALPLDEPEWTSYNVCYRGILVATQLFQARRYATCARLCDALLAYRNEPYFTPDLTALRDAARQAHPGGPPPSLPALQTDPARLLDPFEGVDLARLIVLPPSATLPTK